jgi:hypothetical protein
VGNLVFAGSVVILSVTTRTYRMTATPPGLLSRVIATVKFVSWGAIPVGGVTAGALAGVLGARMSLLVFGAVTVCAPLVWLLSPMRAARSTGRPTGRHDTGRGGGSVGSAVVGGGCSIAGPSTCRR